MHQITYNGDDDGYAAPSESFGIGPAMPVASLVVLAAACAASDIISLDNTYFLTYHRIEHLTPVVPPPQYWHAQSVLRIQLDAL